ncbi:hypothetical protein FGL86_03395 [Pistricoccus aurantiacus]|uniref:Uncharacterized protein n=1 Tax=Pistricoccus aurantiacus TaxID=1883414 RepID=A0A5B8SPH0_9GAMM|nr:hypothetical protein [Pistricoccus aurantiacus]QEA38211.1 hypothetical protein FGL86_03395 [Pistricoccus aurantiacus]
MVTAEGNTTRWYISDAVATYVFEDPANDKKATSIDELWLSRPAPEETHFTGFLDIGPCMRIQMIRHGNGPLELIVEPIESQMDSRDRCGDDKSADDTKGSARSIRLEKFQDNATSKPEWPLSITLEMNIENYPFSGSLRGSGGIGVETYDTNASQVPPMLHEGHVTILGKALATQERFKIMEIPLVLGDEVHLIDREERDIQAACVFYVPAARGMPGFDVSCRAMENTIRINRLGARPFEIPPGLWAYLKNDPNFQALLALIGSVLFVLFQYILDRLFSRQTPTS